MEDAAFFLRSVEDAGAFFWRSLAAEFFWRFIEDEAFLLISVADDVEFIRSSVKDEAFFWRSMMDGSLYSLSKRIGNFLYA